MALEIWWGSGSPYSWRALLALEYKQLSYESHVVQFSKQEHKSPQLLRMNPRGRVPVLQDDDYVCSSRWRSCTTWIASTASRRCSAAPPRRPPRSCASSANTRPMPKNTSCDHPGDLFQGIEGRMEEVERAMGFGLRRRPRSSDAWRRRPGWSARRSRRPTSWCFPGIQMLLRSLERREAHELRARFLPLEAISRRLPRGSAASRRCRATSAPCRRIGRSDDGSRGSYVNPAGHSAAHFSATPSVSSSRE